MMSRKDYVKLAEALGAATAVAERFGGSDAGRAIYDEVYSPLVDYLAADNERFDRSRFSHAVAVAIHNHENR